MSSLELVKDWTVGRLAALLHAVGGEEVAEAILRGDLKVVLEKIVKILFDQHGRRIPRDLKAAFRDPDRNYRFDAPVRGDYAGPLARLQQHFSGVKGLEWPTTAEFEARSKELLVELEAEPQLVNLVKHDGAWFPIVLPKFVVGSDYGRVLEDTFLPAVAAAYTQQYPNRPFNNYRNGELVEKVTVLAESRHQELLDAMAQGWVVAILFPAALHGFSVLADREQMATLPQGFSLTGGVDMVAVLVAYTKELCRDQMTPGMDLAALLWQQAGCSLGFEACDDNLNFDYQSHLGDAHDRFAGGLLFRGRGRS